MVTGSGVGNVDDGGACECAQAGGGKERGKRRVCVFVHVCVCERVNV